MLVQAGNAVIPCALQQALDLPHDESLVHLWPQNTSTNAKGRSSSQDFRENVSALSANLRWQS